MNKNCILKELKHNLHLKVQSLFLCVFISVPVGLITTSPQVIAESFQYEDDQTDVLKLKFSSEYISEKLLLADRNRRENPVLYKQILAELALLEKSFTTEQQSYYQFLQGYLAIYHGDYEQADKLLSEILNSSADKLIKFRANYTLINVAAAKKDWSDGLRHIAVNKEMLPSITDKEHYQLSILTAIIFYNQLQQFDLVLKNIAQVKRHNLPQQHNCFLEQFTLEAKLNLQQIKPDDVSIDTGLDICKQAGNKISTNIIRVYRAKLYLKAQQPEKALAELLPYYDEINTTLFPLLITGMNNTLAKSNYQLGNLNIAEKYALAALRVNKNNTILKQSADSYKLLYQINKSQKNIDLALSYHEKYNALEVAHLEDEKSKHVAFQLAELKTFEHENQITLLNEQNTFLAAEQALSNIKVANIQLIITVMTLIIIMLTIWGARLWRSHKRVKALSEYDELTGIYNRRHFAQIAVSTLKYCQSADQDLSLIMFDLDNFKKINDNFGHICGDWALKETIRVCESIGRKNDIFSRLGGEEFCILLPSCNIEAAVLRAEACRAAIENTITEESGNDFSITASFGVTDVTRSGFNLEKLLTDADFAAYESKHAGRNRVTVFEPQKDETGKSLGNSWSVAP